MTIEYKHLNAYKERHATTDGRVWNCALIITVIFFSTTIASAECREHVELHSVKHVANEYGKSEVWVIQNHRVNVWAKPSDEGKFPKVGEMRPGSRALILEKRGDDYRIKSPLDGSIGWVNELQVSRTLLQDTETRETCKS